MEILGKPMLLLQVERLQRASMMDQLVVATTKNPLDDSIEDLCSSNGVLCFRGSENDVLDRYYQAAKQYNAEYIVRLTGDDPLTDPELVDRMIKKMQVKGCDALTNSLRPSYPEGLDVTILSFKALKEAWRSAKLQSQREHVVPYIFDTNNDFSVYHFQQRKDHSELRWTVDYEEDFRFVEHVYNALYSKNTRFSTDDIYELLEKRPSLKSLNSQFIRNAGLIESLKNDVEVK
jgi:spore coat polysaccharide biosynthesis protein SpsF (cytidylyltransferase family)